MSDKDINVSFTANAEGVKAGANQAANAVQTSVDRMTAAFNKMSASIRADTTAMKEQMREIATSAQNSSSAMASVMGNIRNLFAGVSFLYLAREFIQLSDTVMMLQARLKLATASHEEFVQASKSVYEIAQRNMVGLAEITQLYSKLAEPIRRAGGTAKETTAIVDAFAMSLRISGTTAMEAASATLQFAQAMASGRLNGDEFRAMTEAAPRLLRAMAEGMGVPTEALKKMSSEGKLTADVVGNALIKSFAQLRSEASGLPETVGGAFTRLKNDVMLAADALNRAFSATSTLGGLLADVGILVKEFARSMSELAEEIKNMGGAAKESDVNLRILGTVFEVLALGVGNAAYMIKQIVLELRGLGQQIDALFSRDWKKFTAISDAMKADAERARKEIDMFNAKILGMTDRAVEERNKGAQADAPNEAKPNLKSRLPADSGNAKDTRFETMRQQFQQEIQLQKEFNDTSLDMEIDFWEAKLATVKGSTNNDKKLRFQINQELYNLKKQQYAQDRALDAEAISAGARFAQMEIAQEEDRIKEMKAKGTISLKEALVLEQQAAMQRYQVKADALAKENVLAQGNLLAQKKIANEMKAITMDYLREYEALQVKYEKNVLAEKLAAMRREAEAAGNNLQLRLQIAQQIYEEVRKLYAAESREAQEAAAEVGRVERQLFEQKRRMAQEEIALREKVGQRIVDIAMQGAQLERDLGMMTNVDLLRMTKQLEEERFAIQKQAADERLALLDQQQDYEAYEKALRDKEELTAAHAERMIEINRNIVRESNADLVGAFQNIGQGLSGALQDLMKGTTNFKQFMLNMMQTITNAFFKMFADIIARRIMTGIQEKVFEKASAASRITAQAALAGAGGVASMAAAPYPMNLQAPVFGSIMSGVASSYGAMLAAEQGFDVPAGMSPVTRLHEREMVLPAQYADVIRSLSERGGAAAAAPNVRLEVHPDAMRMTLSDWLQGELARQAAMR